MTIITLIPVSAYIVFKTLIHLSILVLTQYENSNHFNQASCMHIIVLSGKSTNIFLAIRDELCSRHQAVNLKTKPVGNRTGLLLVF